MSYRALLCVLLLALIPRSVQGQEPLVIRHIDVGQGDATLIRGPLQDDGSRVNVLMDAGDITFGGDPDGGVRVLDVLRAEGVDTVDVFIASHYDADHIGGAITGRPQTHGHSFVLGEDGVPGGVGDDDGDGDEDWLDDSMQAPDPEELGKGDDLTIGMFVDRGDESGPDSRTYDKYVALAEAHGNRTSIDTQEEVDSFEIDLGGGATMTLLAANGLVRDQTSPVEFVNTENERSLCFLVELGTFDYVLCGDLIGRDFGVENAEVESAVGQHLIDAGVEVDVLHVNHHGANNASDLEFLEMIRPEVAIISVGNGNPHEHPHLETLKRLAGAGVSMIYQTEWGAPNGEIPDGVRRRQAIYQGDVVIRTDGDSFAVSTLKAFSTDESGS